MAGVSERSPEVDKGAEGYAELGNGYIYGQALRICEAAEARGVIVRLLGATAFVNHCPNHRHLYEETHRKLTDVDLMGYSKTPQNKLDALFGHLGYEPVRALGWHAATRDIYVNDKNLHVDVFRDVLAFSHRISFVGRLELDFPTIPLVDLLLEKLQIVQINAKDLFDVAVLLLEHDIGIDEGGDRELLDLGRATSIWSKDWGFNHTATANLRKAHSHVDQITGMGDSDRAAVRGKIERVLEHMEAVPRSLGWKLRAAVGEKARWYDEVEEVER